VTATVLGLAEPVRNGVGWLWRWPSLAAYLVSFVSFCGLRWASLGFSPLQPFSGAVFARREGAGRGAAERQAAPSEIRRDTQNKGRPGLSGRLAVSHTDESPPLAFRVDRRGGPFARRSPSLQRRAGSALSGRPLEPSPRRTRSRPERGCVSADDNPQRCLRPAVLAVPSQPRPAAHLAARGDICSRYLSSRSQGGRRVPACAVSAENTRLPSPAPLSPPGFPTACLLLACLPRWIARRST